jgi:hypothetical protein
MNILVFVFFLGTIFQAQSLSLDEYLKQLEDEKLLILRQQSTTKQASKKAYYKATTTKLYGFVSSLFFIISLLK